MRSSFAVCAALFAALFLGACGGGGGDGDGDDGPTAEQEVKTAAVKAIENDDAVTFCRKEASKGYIQRIYHGDVGACANSEGSVPEEASTVRATKVVVKGGETHAEVTVVLNGGSYDGATGGVEMVKERGAWKLDDYDDEFIRSSFLAAIQTLDEGAISTPGMKACFTKQVQAMPAAQVRELNDTSAADEEKKGKELLLGMAEKCPESALAEYGATTLTEGVTEKGNHKPGYVKCLYKEFKFLLEVTGITTELLKEHPGFAAVAALEGIAEGAKKNCGG
jgi:hypothetical protein